MRREIAGEFRRLLEDRKDHRVILLEGARQVGKSYLVNDVLAELSVRSHKFDLEKAPRTRRQFEATESFEDFKALLQDQYGVRNGEILFVDEAQECRQLAGYVKSFKEDWPELKVVLTGSSMNRFFDPSVRIPVGRTRSICLFGFSFCEFVEMVKGAELADFIRNAPRYVPPSRHRHLLELFDAYLRVGGYPEAVKAFADNASHAEIREEIMATLQEDFQRKEAYQPELFRSIIAGVSNYVGSPSKLTHFAATKYYSQKALEAMIAWHLVVEVEPRSLDPLRSNFLPKRYLHDLGVLNQSRTLVAPQIALLETLSPALRTPLGGMFENAVLLALLSGKSAKSRVGTWKKNSTTDIEIDFVVDADEDSLRVPIECKAALTLKKKHYKNLLHYLRATEQRIGCCVTAAPFEEINVDEGFRILNIPIYLLTARNLSAYVSG